MNAFDIFALAQSGMDQQQRVLAALAERMVRQPANNPVQPGFATHVQAASAEGGGAPAVPAQSWLSDVLGVNEALRMYRMNATVAGAAKSMIERSLDISGS